LISVVTKSATEITLWVIARSFTFSEVIQVIRNQ
jgi:hypothetical protein